MRPFTRAFAALLAASAVSFTSLPAAYAFSSASSTSPGTSPTYPVSPAPTVDADQATETLRAAKEYYLETRFESIIDPSLRPLADQCAELGANGQVPVGDSVDMRHFGHPGKTCLVQTSPVRSAESSAEWWRLQALEKYYGWSDYRSTVAVGATHDKGVIYTAIVYG